MPSLPPKVHRLLLLLSLFSLMAAQLPKSHTLEQILKENRWKKRVLLVAAPTTEQAGFRAQKALLAPQSAQLAERDFLVLDVVYDDLSEADLQFLAKQLGISGSQFAAVLIGKDGGVKIKSARPIAPASLFHTVDQMPMRRQEMRRGIVDHD
jgi:hypothetical protein